MLEVYNEVLGKKVGYVHELGHAVVLITSFLAPVSADITHQLEQQRSKLEEMQAKATNREKEIEKLATKQVEMEGLFRVQ